MTGIHETVNSEETAYKPISVIDNESYIKIGEPTSEGFPNTSKDIDKLDVSQSHNIVDHYRYDA